MYFNFLFLFTYFCCTYYIQFTLIYICNINYEQPADKSDIFNNIAQYVMD